MVIKETMAESTGHSGQVSGCTLKPLSFPEVERDMRCYYDANHDLPIVCMLCEASFNRPTPDRQPDETAVVSPPINSDDVRQSYLHHLFKEHKLVLHQTSDIASYKCHTRYWKVRFKQTSMSELLPVVKTNPGTPDPPEYFYVLSGNTCPEDKQLRLFLQRKKLEALLDVQQKEREDTTFNQPCLFCPTRCTGNRLSLFQHMFNSHNFSIGQPDNIVFVNEFVDLLRSKLTNLLCLYCERTFRDMRTLKDHVRKKQHRKINPHNKLYDKYYLINYLEPSKTWQEILEENDRELPDDTGTEESDDDDALESCDSFVCLFCPTSLNSINSIVQHMMEDHKFDFCTILLQFDDFYSKVKIINYIRRQVFRNVCIYCQVKHTQLTDHMTVAQHYQLPRRSVWDQPQYLFPTYENDGLLCVLDEEELQNMIH